VAHLALLANPESGSGEAGDVARLLRERGASVEEFALDQLDEVVAAEPGRIVVAGGDGTIGCAAEAASRAGVPLAVVPIGTANDFARALGLPTKREPACELALSGTATRSMELGRIGRRPFVNVASAGLAPIAARKAHGLKALLGPLAYAVGAVRAGLTAAPIACTVRCDGETLFAGDAWQVTVACTGAFGAGAGIVANPHDGRLDVVVVADGARARLAWRALGMRRWRVERQRGVLTGDGDVVELATLGRTSLNVDGEVVEVEDVRFTVEADAYRVVVG
jgi:diacylglycerol kinase (ATP)